MTQEFKVFLAKCSNQELVKLLTDFSTLPPDEYMEAVLAEIKRRKV